MTTAKSRRRARDTGPPRTDPDEKAVLRGFLDYLRDAVVAKATGVPEPQVRTPGVDSGTNLLGLVKHLTHVELFHLLGEPVRDWAATMRPGPHETVEGVVAAYRDVTARANQVIDACADLALPAPRPPGRRAAPSMRWVLVHLVEETARHAGHADLLRERIDGSTGR